MIDPVYFVLMDIHEDGNSEEPDAYLQQLESDGFIQQLDKDYWELTEKGVELLQEIEGIPGE